MRRIVLGTRGSALALWQANHVERLLRDAHPGLELEQRIIRTEGDIQQHAPLVSGDRGFFVRRIEQALLEGEIDLAVHSLKDLPTQQPDALLVAAVPERHDPRDAVLSVEGWSFDEIPAGTVLATGSPRRRAQLLHARPELSTQPVRGNVDTRVGRLEEGRYGALVLALAGVQRLGIDRVPIRPIDPRVCLPAVGQGALAVETRIDDEETRNLVAVLNHTPSSQAVEAERSFLHTLGGGCLAPATGYARIDGELLQIEAAVGEVDGRQLMKDAERGRPGEATEVGARLAERMLEAGAGELLERAREAAQGDGDG
jgi:hydroxymethylbilane synthase